MKFKPKEIMVNLPVVLPFVDDTEVVQMAAAFNTFVHGKVKMKYEILGTLGGQTMGLFYIQRNNESQELRDEFMRLISAEEMGTLGDEPKHTPKSEPIKKNTHSKSGYTFEEIREMRGRGILINDEGEFCREVPECTCGCRSNNWGGWQP